MLLINREDGADSQFRSPSCQLNFESRTSKDGESCSSDGEDDGEGESLRRRGMTPEEREAAKAARKQHKKEVKESNKERRRSRS